MWKSFVTVVSLSVIVFAAIMVTGQQVDCKGKPYKPTRVKNYTGRFCYINTWDIEYAEYNLLSLRKYLVDLFRGCDNKFPKCCKCTKLRGANACNQTRLQKPKFIERCRPSSCECENGFSFELKRPELLGGFDPEEHQLDMAFIIGELGTACGQGSGILRCPCVDPVAEVLDKFTWKEKYAITEIGPFPGKPSAEQLFFCGPRYCECKPRNANDVNTRIDLLGRIIPKA